MEPRLTGINDREVLMYLGYHGGPTGPDFKADLRRCKQILLDTARPRAVFREFQLDENKALVGTTFQPQGENIRELLRDCHHAILFGATLGAEIEALLRRTQIQHMGDAVILDCCASAAIENVCDNLCDDLQQRWAPSHLTDRFSPGYGDFPFAQQPEFCATLDMPRRIGVHLSPTGLMIPQKSVTALIGVSDRPQTKRFRGCAYCNQFDHCTYRREGTTCGHS